jgi:hypothetical protein
MSQIYYYGPGAKAALFFETLDGYGLRSDGYGVLPSITRILFPNLSIAVGFPQYMTKVDVGLFRYFFTLPTGSASVGSYLVDILYQDPDTFANKQTFMQIVVAAPAGSYSISAV